MAWGRVGALQAEPKQGMQGPRPHPKEQQEGGQWTFSLKRGGGGGLVGGGPSGEASSPAWRPREPGLGLGEMSEVCFVQGTAWPFVISDCTFIKAGG